MRPNINKPQLLIATVVLYVAFSVLLYQSTVSSFVHIWVTSEYDTYKHGVILLIASIYFFSQSWSKISNKLYFHLNVPGFLLLVLASFVWFLSVIADVLVVQQLLFVLIIVLVLWTIFGYQNMRQLAFPVLLLICAIPVWSLINEGWLQSLIAKIVTATLRLAGVNTYLEGVMIYIPAGVFHVEPGCSGMQQLVAAISIASIYAYLNKFRLRYLVIYVALASIISFIINTTRIFIVVMAGQLSDMEHYLVQEEHITLGWVLFGIGIFIFMLLSNKFLVSWQNTIILKEENAAPNSNEYRLISKWKYITTMLLVLAGLSTGPVLAHLQELRADRQLGKLLIPSTFKEWHIKDKEDENYHPNFTAGDIVYEAVYSDSDEAVYCYIGYFLEQSQGKELISSLNKVYDSKEWISVSTIKYNIAILNREVSVQETRIKSRMGKEKLVWNWYFLTGTRTSSPEIAKLLGIWGELTGQPSAASFLVATEISDNKENARIRLNRFLNDSLAEMEDAIEQVSG